MAIDRTTRFRQMTDLLQLKNASEEFDIGLILSMKKSMTGNEISEELGLLRKRYDLFVTMMTMDYGLEISGVYNQLDAAWMSSVKKHEEALTTDIVQYGKVDQKRGTGHYI